MATNLRVNLGTKNRERREMATNFPSTALSVVTIAYLLERLRVSVLDEFLDKKLAGVFVYVRVRVCVCVCMCAWEQGGRMDGCVDDIWLSVSVSVMK